MRNYSRVLCQSRRLHCVAKRYQLSHFIFARKSVRSHRPVGHVIAAASLGLYSLSSNAADLSANGESLFIITSALERLVTAAIGGLIVTLGYKLFDHAIEHESNLEASTPTGYKLKLQRVAPGVLFALFGACLLGTSLMHRPTYGHESRAAASPSNGLDQSNAPTEKRTVTTETTEIRGMTDVATDNAADLKAKVLSITTVRSMCSAGRIANLSSSDKAILNKAQQHLETLKATLIDQAVGPGSYDWYQQQLTEVTLKPNTLKEFPPKDRARYDKVMHLVVDPLSEVK